MITEKIALLAPMPSPGASTATAGEADSSEGAGGVTDVGEEARHGCLVVLGKPRATPGSKGLEPGGGDLAMERRISLEFGHLVFDHPSVEQVNAAAGVRGVAGIVGHHADGSPGAVQRLEQFHHRLAVGAVEVTGGLVGEEDQRLARDRPGHRHALLLPPESCEG
ncbi:MAG: hypothetical protein U0133_06375 [Gemmatimonadales bacterium]